MDNVASMTTDDNVKTATAPTDQQLRDAMVSRLIELGAAPSPRVQATFRTVPRHLATPEVDMAKTYDAGFAAITKTDETGVDISSVSAPRVQAMQIEQAKARGFAESWMWLCGNPRVRSWTCGVLRVGSIRGGAARRGGLGWL